MLKRSFIFNLLLVIAIVVGLLFLFFNSLNWLTNHGKETKVPNLVGKNMNNAVSLLKQKGFRVQIDSTYQSYEDPLEVLYQEPEQGATVKYGRTIFLTVNKKSTPKISMPNLVNLSFRNALLTMQSYRLQMGDTLYRPDVAAGAVLEQRINGKIIAPGTQIPYGSRIDLVIGEGLSGEQDVPNLIGKTFSEAKATIQSLGLTYNAIWDGTIDDSVNAIVYQQAPESLNELDFQNTILSGDIMDIRLMQNPSPELLDKNQPGSRKLLGESQNDSNLVVVNPADFKVKDSTRKSKRIPSIDDGKSKPKVDPNKDKFKEVGRTAKPDANGKVAPKKKKQQPNNTNPVKQSDDNIKNEFE